MVKSMYKTKKRLEKATELQKSTSKFTRRINALLKQIDLLKNKLRKRKEQATLDHNTIEELKREIKQWKETCEIISNPKTMKSISKSLKEFAEGKGIPLDKLEV